MAVPSQCGSITTELGSNQSESPRSNWKLKVDFLGKEGKRGTQSKTTSSPGPSYVGETNTPVGIGWSSDTQTFQMSCKLTGRMQVHSMSKRIKFGFITAKISA